MGSPEHDDAPDDFTVGHSLLAFVVPVILAVILLCGAFAVLSTIHSAA